ncbi:MAG: hypothetical protein II075_06180 [Bacteroidales bacterium]|nr:hypothetical protein [Bacteroidales bacterium]MBQ2099341.1 hypothetical protein [Bacteroidales bacterium]
MKKFLLIAAAALIGFNAAEAQDPKDISKTWEKTITVPTSQATIVEKLFTAWGKQFPGDYVDAFIDFKKNPTWYTSGSGPYLIDFAPKNGYLNITATVQLELALTAVYWNLPNGNKLFGVTINECREAGEGPDDVECDFSLAFYEYDVKKGTMTPRADVVKKVLSVTNCPNLPKEGRDIEYWDEKSESHKKLKWTGNGF